MVGPRPRPPGRSGRSLRPGISIIWHDELGSTNEEARRLAEGGGPGGTIVAAVSQTAGKGRHGRSWVSLAGNLHASFLLRPGPPAGKAPELGFAAALAVADTLRHYLHPSLPVRLKWPNDVLLAGGKVAGILIESAAGWAVIGIGVNLAHSPADLPYPSEALSTFVMPPSPAEFLSVLESSLHAWLARLERERFAAIASAWLALGPVPGEELTIRTGMETISGRFAGLDPGGQLLIETAAGICKIVSGEILVPTPLASARRKEIGGPSGAEPTRYGDWQFKGRVSDF